MIVNEVMSQEFILKKITANSLRLNLKTADARTKNYLQI